MNTDDTLVVRYVGYRPFRVDAKDAPLRYGDVVDADHVYAQHRRMLLTMTDFEEINPEESQDG